MAKFQDIYEIKMNCYRIKPYLKRGRAHIKQTENDKQR
jgi:hypothetical protein